MSLGANLFVDFSGTVNIYGESCRVKYYKATYSGTGYDTEYLTPSGNDTWTKGMHFPVKSDKGGEDFKYLEQGKIQLDDRRLFIMPTANLSGANLKIGIGSPVKNEYKILNEGARLYSLQGVDIYKKVYIRLLNNGSFYGEY